MSKQHFEAIAQALRDTRPGGASIPIALHQWTRTRDALAEVCGRYNLNFDRSRFNRATEEPQP